MLLAIDVGNTHTVFGLWDGSAWRAVWRLGTDTDVTEDATAASLKVLFDMSAIPFRVDSAIAASVVPGVDAMLTQLCQKWLGVPLHFVRQGVDVQLEVKYEPIAAVGADRIANALAALARWNPPILVVDFGTATTFDAIDAEGIYVGGAILPGLVLSSQALASRTAKLPQVAFVAPATAIGKTTAHSIQSGLMFGYAGAIDRLARTMNAELGGHAKVVATGGLGKLFVGLCETLEEYHDTLTLDGLVIAQQRLEKGRA
jgi:type III pantothenate kinase